MKKESSATPVRPWLLGSLVIWSGSSEREGGGTGGSDLMSVPHRWEGALIGVRSYAVTPPQNASDFAKLERHACLDDILRLVLSISHDRFCHLNSMLSTDPTLRQICCFTYGTKGGSFCYCTPLISASCQCKEVIHFDTTRITSL